MQHTTKWMLKSFPLIIGSLLSFNILAEDAVVEENEDSSIAIESDECQSCKLSGSATLGYDTNIYSRSDHRSVRNISWRGSLNYSFNDAYRLYFNTGGYRALEDEVGTYMTDTIVGLSRAKLYQFGETGAVGIAGQFTIPTSETSRKDSLNTAFRLAIPVSFKLWDANISISPRVSKSFHEYKTSGGKSLTEWIYSISMGANYRWDKLEMGISALGGNSRSYQGTRRTELTYAGSIYAGYDLAENIGISLAVSTAGFYADAERGTLGNIDLFDPDRATYIAEISYSF